MCDIRDSKEDSLTTWASLFYEKGDHKFQKLTEVNMQTLASLCQMYVVPTKQDEEEGWCVISYI